MLLRRFAFASSAAVISVVAVLGAGAACTHDREPVEAVIDAPRPEVEQITDAQQLPVSVLVDGADRDADLSCLAKGQPDAGPLFPAETGSDAGDDAEPIETGTDAGIPLGTLHEKTIELIGFGTGGADKLANQTIDVYYSNSFTLGAPNATVVSDGAGLVKVVLPEGLRVAYHVRKSSLLGDYYALDDLHEPLPGATPGKPAVWQGVTLERQDVLALAITGQKGYTIKPGTGIVAGRVMDCSRRYMQHASISLYDYTDSVTEPKKLEMVKCGQGLCLVYLSDAELPDIGRTSTSRAGLFALIDVPVGRKLRLVAEGLDKGANKQVAWRNLEVREGGIATHLLEPNASLAPPTP